MKAYRGRVGQARRGSPTNFSGDVVFDPLTSTEYGTGTSVGAVQFSPGARTFWHSHPGGQVLIVLAGEGRVTERGGRSLTVRAGDVIEAAPDEEHWHGAAASAYLVHVAVSMGQTRWLEEVADDDYRRADASAEAVD